MGGAFHGMAWNVLAFLASSRDRIWRLSAMRQSQALAIQTGAWRDRSLRDEAPAKNRLLHMQPILRLVENNRLGAVHHLRVDLLVEPCPGIYSVLSLLKKNKVPMALVSNGLGKGYGKDIIEKFGLSEYFPITIFREDIKKSKPHPEPLLLALRELKIEPSKDDVIWYIGDRHKDITAAQNAEKHVSPAKIVPIAYAVNAAVAAVEKGYGPDHILMSYQDVYTVLKELITEA